LEAPTGCAAPDGLTTTRLGMCLCRKEFRPVIGPYVILTLKIAVTAVTLLFAASLVALARRNYRLHGRINIAFFTLTVTALLGLEGLVRVLDPHVFDYFTEDDKRALFVHLCFSLPAAALLPLMLYTGLTHRFYVHVTLAVLFSLLWIGTFVTGIFFLPHTGPQGPWLLP
jgi:hypothetical protein